MTKRLSIILLGIIIAFATIIGNFNLSFFVNAEEQEEIQPIINTPLVNENFTSAGTSYPSVPSGWTASTLNDKLSSDVAAGVISLDVSSILEKVDDKDNPYKLPGGFKDSIDFNKIVTLDQDDENDHILMISSLNTVAYSYKSSTYTINANSFYELSVYVYTPDFSTIGENANYGAFVAISGDITAVSQPINTKHTWQKYSIYFSGYSYKSASVAVSLQLGDYRTVDDVKSLRPASGYAFFDKVELKPVSYNVYQNAKNSVSNKVQIAEELIDDITPAEYNGDFENGLNNWKGINNTALVTVSSDVYLPFGTQALKMTSQGQGKVYGGIRSSKLNIERHKYYRIGIWQNSNGVLSGSGYATAVALDENNNYETLATLNNFSQNLGKNSWLGNWNQGSFFVQGSALMDKEIFIELWFGNSTSKASGTIYFDNITLEEILPEEYTANSSNGTTVTFSDAAGSTTLANGDFNSIGNYNTYSYPMPVASWTSVFEEENEEKTVAGIIRGDKEHFDANRDNYGAPSYPYTSNQANTNLLMIANTSPSAYGYSTSVSVDANSYKKISIKLQTQLSTFNYGAELVLKKNNVVVSRYSDINTNGQFKTYNFYVNSGLNAQTLSLEIWLGKEGGFNNQYYTKGHLFVEYADAVASDETAFNNANGDYDKKYSFLTENFETFEESANALKTPSNWIAVNPLTDIKTVKAGIINLNEYDASVLGGIDKSKIGTDNVSPYALAIFSSEPTAYGMKQSFPVTYTADSYYKITVRIKTVDIPEGCGARIVLDADNYFEGINTQFEKNNFGNKFIDYSFFINVGSASSVTHNLTIWLGDNSKTYTLAKGLVVVDQITIQSIDEAAYADGIAKLSSDDEEEIPHNVAKVVLSETASEEPPVQNQDKKSFEWWLLPTILFSALLVFCLVMIIVRFVPKPRRRVKTGSTTYDRRLTINKTINKKKEEQPENKPQERVEEIQTFEEAVNTQEPEQNEVDTPAPKLIRRRKHIIKEYKDEFED